MSDIQMIPSPMGGGWAVPLTEAGRQSLAVFFEEGPCFLPPLGEDGYIVEPYEEADLADYLAEDGITYIA